MATYSNLFIDQGSTFNFTIDLEKTSGASLDLTNYSARGQIRKSYSSTAATDFTISVDAANTELNVSLTATQTNNLKPGRYVYDIEIEDDSNPAIVTRILQGQVTVTPRVTTTN